MKRFVKRVLLWSAVALVLIQAVPYGRSHDNPPVAAEPTWPSSQVRALAQRACFDCHSNESRWPWYSHVAPMSWLVQRDVDEGRKHLNFSEWDRPQRHAKDAAGELEEGEMPPWFYLPLHAEARLTDAEKAELVAGLKAVALARPVVAPGSAQPPAPPPAVVPAPGKSDDDGAPDDGGKGRGKGQDGGYGYGK